MCTPVTLPAEPSPASAPAWERAYPGTASQLRLVRAAVRSLLDGCPAADDAVLVVSELAANAVTHSASGQPGGTLTVRLQHACGEQVRAEVQDQGSDWDGDLAAAARHPHGLGLVTALSAACGTGRGPGRSRLVWAQIDDRAAGPASAAGGTA
jgi:Histidine kinase-like ATPase domain